MALRVDRYEVSRLIGQGAMGKVYLAVDPRIGRQVAIKVLAGGQADAATRQRFRLEARAIAALKHPNIVELYDYSGENAADLFLVMEYIEGLSLAGWMRQHGAFSEPTALCVGHELCLALGHAHRRQIVHRDIKPENVLLAHGRVVLTDFGIVKALAKSAALGISRVVTRTQILGTPGFMAPEQFAGRQIDRRTDIFAVGALLYNLGTDKPPFAGDTVDEVYTNLKHGRYPDPRKHNALLSPGFCSLVHRCLAMKPQDRFASAEDLRQQILSLLGSHGVSEVRQELVAYEENPATYAIEQRRRTVDVMLRDLKVALSDRDEDMANSIIKWVQTLAPLDKRMLDVAGVQLDDDRRPVVRDLKPRRLAFFSLGLVLGLAIGAATAVVGSVREHLPSTWKRRLDAVVAWIIPGR